MAPRIPESTRAAVLQAIAPYRRPDGTYPVGALTYIGEMFDVSRRSILRMLREKEIETPTETPLLNEDAIITTLYQFSGRAKQAWNELTRSGTYGASYRTFLRDLDRMDPALRAAARNGAKGMQANFIYLKSDSTHRNERWHLDHTKADIWVQPERGSAYERPWITVITDRKTGAFMAVDAYLGAPNTERVIATLVRAIVGDRDESGQLILGGVPNSLVFDNALEHFSQALTKGCMSLGITALPTVPHQSWQNGQVERAHRTMADDLFVRLPGYTHAGHTDDRKPRFAPSGPDQASPVQLLTLDAFRRVLDGWRKARNSTHKTSSGMTPIELWKLDTTEIREVSDLSVLRAMLLDGGQRVVHNAGIRFRNLDYLCPSMAGYRGKKLSVRYLSTVTDWIEVFDGNTYVGRATVAERLSEKESRQILRNRQEVKKKVNAHLRLARDLHDHTAQTANEMFDSELSDSPSLGSALELIEGAQTVRKRRIRKTSGKANTRRRTYKPSQPKDVLRSVAALDLSALQREEKE